MRKTRFVWPGKSVMPFLALLALTTSLGTLGFAFGVTMAPVSVIATLGFASPLVTTLYGMIVYKERLGMMQYLGSLMIVGGVVGISLF